MVYQGNNLIEMMNRFMQEGVEDTVAKLFDTIDLIKSICYNILQSKH